MLPGHRADADRERAAARQGPAAHAARSGRRAVPRIHHAQRLARPRSLVLLFIFLYKLGDSMATALATPFYLDMGFTKTDIGVIAKNAGLWASVDRRAARRPVDGEDRHQSRPVAVRRRAARVDPGLRVARLRQPAGPAAAGVRHRVRGARRRPRHGGVHRVHRARDRSALHGDAIRAVHQPRGRAAHAWSTRRPAGSSSAPAGSTSICCAPCWRCPAWLLLLRVAPWGDDPIKGHPR